MIKELAGNTLSAFDSQLSGLSHGFPLHQEGGLDFLEPSTLEVVKPVVDHSLVEIDTVPSEEESSVSRDFGSCCRQVPIM